MLCDQTMAREEAEKKRRKKNSRKGDKNEQEKAKL